MQDTEVLYQTIIDTCQEGAWLIDAKAITTYVNRRMAEMLGYTVEEMLGRSMYDFMDGGARSEAERNFRRRKSGVREQHDFRLRRKDGTELWTIMSTNPILGERGEFHGALAMVTDITERKRAEEVLRESEARFRAIFEETGSGNALSDMRGRILETNRAMQEMLGYSAEELRRMRFADFTHPDCVDGEMKLFQELVAGERQNYQVEKCCLRKDGDAIWIRVIVSLIRDAEGRPLYACGAAENITERKRAEDAERASRQQYESLVESLDGIVWEADPQTFNFTFVSRQAERILGYPLEQWLDEPSFWANHLHPEDRDRAVSYCLETVAKRMNHQFEYRMIAVDGRVVWFRDIVTLIVMDDKSLRLRGVLVDITELERERDARMKLLRRLVGAQEEERYHIARELHDHVGQYTAALMMGLKSLQKSTGPTPSEQTQLTKLQELTRQFSQEVRRFSLDLRPSALDDFGLPVALTHYIEEWSKRNEIKVDFQSDGLINKRFPRQIETALFRLTQEALNNVLKHAQAKHVSVILEYRDGRVLAILEDDGIGFDIAAALDAPVSERGLGLTGMRERIESVGGRLEIESASGAGTTIVARISTSSYKPSDTSE